MSRHLWQELRRRKVFRTAGLYVVGAWVVIQVGDVFFPAWGLPDSSLRYLFIAAVACFPIALVFGWFYDLSSQGIVRTPPAADAQDIDLRLKKSDLLLLAALLGIAAIIVVESAGMIRQDLGAALTGQSASDRPLHSIAVMPFKNLGQTADTTHFSDGITEDIQVSLSLLKALHVKAASSSFALRNSGLDASGVSELLGVRYLLEGSVRIEGGYVRVTAHLVDAEGFHVWSDTFDRRFEGLFVVQSEIASTVASRIVEEIIPARELPAGRTTNNMEAYSAYLRGRAFFEARSLGWQKQADRAFRYAIELDPGYAPPYAGLATLVLNSNRGPHWDEARRMAETSLELDPDLPIGHAILGLTLSVLDDPERGLEALQRAIELDPSLSIAYQWITHPLHALSRHESARKMEQRGLEIDPLNSTLIKNNADHASRHGNFERAEALLLRLTMLPEPTARTHFWLHEFYHQWGRYNLALASSAEHIRLALSRDAPAELQPYFFDLAQLGLREETAHWYERYRSTRSAQDVPIFETLMLARVGDRQWLAQDLDKIDALDNEAHPIQDVIYLLGYGGLARIHNGEYEIGLDWLERALAEFHGQPEIAATYEGTLDFDVLAKHWGNELAEEIAVRLFHAYTTTGREFDAQGPMHYLQKINTARGGRANPWLLERRALFEALSGDRGAALASLEQASELGWCNYLGVINDVAWAETITTSEFESVIQTARSCFEAQRALVEPSLPDTALRSEFESRLVP